MKKLIFILLIFLADSAFPQDTISTIDSLVNYKLFDSISGTKKPTEIYVDGQLIYVKDFYFDKNFNYDQLIIGSSTKGPLLKAEYFRLNQDTFYVVNYDSLEQITSCGKIVAKNPLKNRIIITYQEGFPPYFNVNIGYGFKIDYKTGQWQEMEISNNKIWIGDYLSGKKNGQWILFKYSEGIIDKKTIYKTTLYK